MSPTRNFHLADFEAIPQRVSSLDTLEKHHRDLVRSCIADRERQRRDLIRAEAIARSQERTARRLGAQLVALGDAVRFNQPSRAALAFDVGATRYGTDKVQSCEFWEHLATEGSLTVSAARPQYAPTELAKLSRENLRALFPDGMTAGSWKELDEAEHTKKLRDLDPQVALLRGASFEALAKRPEFTHDGKAFNELIEQTLRSELARDLVRRGFVNRNYAEYSATFYGNFVGVDVAFFYNHSVQPNQMYLDHQFQNPSSIPNLLEQAPGDFTSSVSVFNLQIVSYLLRENIDAAKEVVAFLVSDFSTEAQTFLDAFVNTAAAPSEQLIELLSAHPWGGVFDYLANHEGVPGDETRLKLLDAALLAAGAAEKYKLNEGTDKVLAENYAKLTAFTHDQSQTRTEITFAFAERAGFVITDLGVLSSGLRQLIVDEHLYDLSADNLRVALGIEGAVTLDEVRKNHSVWAYCRENIDEYLEAVRNDETTGHTVQSATVLGEVLTEQHEPWTGEQLAEVLILSAPSSTLPILESAPAATWPQVVDAARLEPSVANLTSYTDANGVDEHLAALLVPGTGDPTDVQVHEDADDDDERVALAARLLNASSSIPSAAARVRLAVSLNLSADAISATDLTPTSDDLLALALKAELVPDAEETFQHFVAAGWRSVEKAFAVSKNVGAFLIPQLVSGVVAEFLSSTHVPVEIRAAVLEHLDEYVIDSDQVALRAAGRLAQQERVKLPLGEVRRIAQATQDPDLVLPQLVWASSTSPDELIETLVLLGVPYTGLAGEPGHEFDLPPGSSNQTLFTRLEGAGKVEIIKKALRGRKIRILD